MVIAIALSGNNFIFDVPPTVAFSLDFRKNPCHRCNPNEHREKPPPGPAAGTVRRDAPVPFPAPRIRRGPARSAGSDGTNRLRHSPDRGKDARPYSAGIPGMASGAAVRLDPRVSERDRDTRCDVSAFPGLSETTRKASAYRDTVDNTRRGLFQVSRCEAPENRHSKDIRVDPVFPSQQCRRRNLPAPWGNGAIRNTDRRSDCHWQPIPTARRNSNNSFHVPHDTDQTNSKRYFKE